MIWRCFPEVVCVVISLRLFMYCGTVNIWGRCKKLHPHGITPNQKHTQGTNLWRSIIQQLTTYSMTNVSAVFVWMMSWRQTMFACFKPFRSDASLIAVKGAPSSCCRRISLSATTCWLTLKERERGEEIKEKGLRLFCQTGKVQCGGECIKGCVE